MGMGATMKKVRNKISLEHSPVCKFIYSSCWLSNVQGADSNIYLSFYRNCLIHLKYKCYVFRVFISTVIHNFVCVFLFLTKEKCHNNNSFKFHSKLRTTLQNGDLNLRIIWILQKRFWIEEFMIHSPQEWTWHFWLLVLTSFHENGLIYSKNIR